MSMFKSFGLKRLELSEVFSSLVPLRAESSESVPVFENTTLAITILSMHCYVIKSAASHPPS